MTEDELKRRTKQFPLRIMRPVAALPRTVEARVIGKQLVEAGTSVGANYRAACRARSRAEFVAKLGIAEEEADESGYWLELIIEGGLMPEKSVAALHKEAGEVLAIISSSRLTALRRSEIENRRSKIENGSSRVACHAHN